MNFQKHFGIKKQFSFNKIKPGGWRDNDKDGVPNFFDCQPNNINRQGYYEEARFNVYRKQDERRKMKDAARITTENPKDAAYQALRVSSYMHSPQFRLTAKDLIERQEKEESKPIQFVLDDTKESRRNFDEYENKKADWIIKQRAKQVLSYKFYTTDYNSLTSTQKSHINYLIRYHVR